MLDFSNFFRTLLYFKCHLTARGGLFKHKSSLLAHCHLLLCHFKREMRECQGEKLKHLLWSVLRSISAQYFMQKTMDEVAACSLPTRKMCKESNSAVSCVRNFARLVNPFARS